MPREGFETCSRAKRLRGTALVGVRVERMVMVTESSILSRLSLERRGVRV